MKIKLLFYFVERFFKILFILLILYDFECFPILVNGMQSSKNFSVLLIKSLPIQESEKQLCFDTCFSTNVSKELRFKN